MTTRPHGSGIGLCGATSAVILMCLAAVPFAGCSAILRALNIRYGNLPLGPGEAPLDPGTYSASSPCTTLVVVEGESPIRDETPFAVEVWVNENRRLSRNGVAVDTGEIADLSIGTYDLVLTNTATEASRDAFAALHSVEIIIDAGTPAELRLVGAATETFMQAADGGVLYALASELVEQGEDGAPGPRTLAVQCEFPLPRQ